MSQVYKVPGVYFQEIQVGPQPIQGVSLSTAGFLGITEIGPSQPTLVTSMPEYQRIFGEPIPDKSYLSYAVEGFFTNQGEMLYIGRITAPDALPATATITAGTTNKIYIRAVGPGNNTNNISLKVQQPALNDKTKSKFRLDITYTSISGNPVLETYDNVSINPKDIAYYRKQINAGSNIVEVFDDIKPQDSPTPPTPIDIPLSNGTDGTTIDVESFKGTEIPVIDPSNNKQTGTIRTGLKGFEGVPDIGIVSCPDEEFYDGVRQAVVEHCEIATLYRTAILPTHSDEIKPDTINQGANGAYVVDSLGGRAALYYPMIKVYDSVTKDQKSVPNCGHIAGIYARSDQLYGVDKDPANEVVQGATALQVQVTWADQQILNPRNIDVIRTFQNRGIVLYGGRATCTDSQWMYISTRRLFNYIEKSLDIGLQGIVFQINNEKLWSRVVATITQFLTDVWRSGALMGTSPEQAFWVKCDRTTMTQNDLDNGRLIVWIGIAVAKPAEFVIIKIAQTAEGSQVTEL
jgi:uncharacterized protein